jgi:hypothetical protein
MDTPPPLPPVEPLQRALNCVTATFGTASGGRISVRSDSLYRLKVQRLAGYFICKRELHACGFPSRLSKSDCTVYPPISCPLLRGGILLSDILGRRRPVGFVRDSYPIRSGTL